MTRRHKLDGGGGMASKVGIYFGALKSLDCESVESSRYSGIHSKETNLVDQNILPPHLPSIKQMQIAKPSRANKKAPKERR